VSYEHMMKPLFREKGLCPPWVFREIITKYAVHLGVKTPELMISKSGIWHANVTDRPLLATPSPSFEGPDNIKGEFNSESRGQILA